MEAALAKRAHTYRSPLLSLWFRNELADNVVAFLPPDHLPKLPVIAKPFRAAQPLVLFTAARRLKVVDQMLASCVDVLRDVVPEANRFVETWASGLGKWQMHPEASGYLHADVVGSPPCLRLRGTPGPTHEGLSRSFQSLRKLTVRRLRISRWSCMDIRGALGYVWFYDHRGQFEKCVGGVYKNGGQLCFLARDANEGPNTTMLCPVDPDTRYDIDASFSDADEDHMMDATITVSIAGVPQVTRSIRSLAMPLSTIKLYNYSNGEAHIGEIEVEFDRA